MSQRLGLYNFTYNVPEHAQTLPYMLGGLALAGFAVLIASGIYMAQFYNPNQIGSNQSVMYLVTQAPFGNFVRSVHFWAANLVFAIVVLHLVRTFVSGSYKRPREFTWLLGLGLLGVTMAFIFTGTMLSLGQESVEALEHNSEAGLLLGPLGTWFTTGFSASVPLIGRVYVAHMVILAGLFFLLIAAHFYMVKVHGISPKASKNAVVAGKDSEGKGHFNQHLKKLAGWSLILIALLSALALIRPEALGGPGTAGIEASKPPWMFLWIFGFENLFGIKSLLWGPGVIFGILALFPFIDRSPYLSPRRRPWIMTLGTALLIVLAGLTISGWRTKIDMKMTGSTSGFLPQAVQRAEQYVFPVAYAHGMPTLTFSPSVTTAGSSVKFSGDGLKTDGAYDVYLKGAQTSIWLGEATVDKGEDMFDADLKIPATLPGGMYSVELRSAKNSQFDLYSPLQLTVQSSSTAMSESMPSSQRYAIPHKDIPWIIGLIAICLILGIALLIK